MSRVECHVVQEIETDHGKRVVPNTQYLHDLIKGLWQCLTAKNCLIISLRVSHS